ncbi:MAG: hypothetical protein ACE1ZD_01525 [Dehalococcoidia bacterium]
MRGLGVGICHHVCVGSLAGHHFPSFFGFHSRASRCASAITSGASTPEVLVDEVISKLKPDSVSTLKGIGEDVTFTLPKELR